MMYVQQHVSDQLNIYTVETCSIFYIMDYIAFAVDYATVDILPYAISCYATYDQHSPSSGLLIIQV